jgi:cell division protein FtsW
MIMVFLPVIGTELEGARRWIGIGSMTFQPSELLKLTFILYLALWLEKRTEEKQKSGVDFKKNFIAFGAALGAVAFLLILQPDISTLAVTATTATIMYFLSGTMVWHSIAIVLSGLVGLLALIKIAPYRMNRFLVFLNPELDPMGIGYQVKHAIISVGSGGVIGLGLGMGTQKFGLLPQSISDSVFAVFSEETGFIRTFFLVFLFLMFLWRGFKVVKGSPDKFSKLAAAGIICWICLQTFVNIGSMTGVLPLMGIPMPFVSYGGTALMFELAAMGILLNISRKSA